MARGDTISTTVPSVGDAETAGTTDLLTILADLVTIAETKVTPSEIDMDATLDFNSQAAENVKYVEFITQNSSPGNEMLYTKNDGATDELYFTNGSGSEVQITDGGALNVAATGSITGAGYGSGGVAVNWNSAGTNYQMKSGSGADDYAAVTCDGLQLRDGSSHAVTLDSPSLAASYTVTFANAVPGSESFLTLDNSGQLAYADNATPYTNFKHAGVTVTANLGSATEISGSASFSRTNAVQGDWYNATTTGTQGIGVPLDVKPGDVITNIGVFVETNNNPDTITFDLRRINLTGGTDSSLDTQTYAASGTASWDVSDTTVAAGYQYYLKISWPGASGTQIGIAGVTYTYQR